MAHRDRMLRVEDYVPAEPPEVGEVQIQGAGAPAEQRSEPALLKLLEEIAATVRIFEMHAQEVAEGARRLVSDAKGNPPRNLDSIIDQLQELEERSRLKPHLKTCAEHRETFAHDPNPRFRLKATTLVRRYEEAIIRVLEVLRDVRWELMAFRAELEGERGRIFDDPEELSRHLKEL